MKFLKSRYWQYGQYLILIVLAIAVFCFWLFLYPFIPVVREMTQLFLWTGDYFLERIMLPGGLAQYLGEMIAQFFINPVNGAIAYALLFLVARQLSGLWLRKAFPQLKAAYRFALSLVLPALLWALAMLPQVPLTTTIAIILVLGVGCVLMTCPKNRRLWALLLAIPVTYWLAGPAALLLICCCPRWIPATLLLFAACVVGSAFVTPYPLRQVAMGIDYMENDNRIGMRMSTYEEMGIYFSSLDASGKATKPFLLPQRNPKEYYRQLLYSYNTPDFAIRPLVAHPRELGRKIESDKRYLKEEEKKAK